MYCDKPISSFEKISNGVAIRVLFAILYSADLRALTLLYLSYPTAVHVISLRSIAIQIEYLFLYFYVYNANPKIINVLTLISFAPVHLRVKIHVPPSYFFSPRHFPAVAPNYFQPQKGRDVKQGINHTCRSCSKALKIEKLKAPLIAEWYK